MYCSEKKIHPELTGRERGGEGGIKKRASNCRPTEGFQEIAAAVTSGSGRHFGLCFAGKNTAIFAVIPDTRGTNEAMSPVFFQPGLDSRNHFCSVLSCKLHARARTERQQRRWPLLWRRRPIVFSRVTSRIFLQEHRFTYTVCFGEQRVDEAKRRGVAWINKSPCYVIAFDLISPRLIRITFGRAITYNHAVVI